MPVCPGAGPDVCPQALHGGLDDAVRELGECRARSSHPGIEVGLGPPPERGLVAVSEVERDLKRPDRMSTEQAGHVVK